MALELRFTIPGQIERIVPIKNPPLKIGALLSNEVVIRAPGVEPIHALIEADGDNSFRITDLGSSDGVLINGQPINVEAAFQAGDEIIIGSVTLKVASAAVETVPLAVPTPLATPSEAKSENRKVVGAPSTVAANRGTVRVSEEEAEGRRHEDTLARGEGTQAGMAPAPEQKARRKDILFAPRNARPQGEVLECVAYWGDTVLDVELFHQTYKGYDKVTIGDPTKAHLIAAGKAQIDRHVFAEVGGDGFQIHMLDGMQGRLRRGGKVERVSNAADISLGNRDIAHVKYGAVSYFLMFVRPPALDFPKTGPSDPFFLGIMSVLMLIYFVLVPMAWIHKPTIEKKDKDDIWQVVQVPEKDQKPEPEKKKEPEKKPEPVKKPEVKVAEKKTPPPTPPKPTPKPVVKPAKAVEKEKPVQTKPVEKPVEEPKKPTEVLAEKKPTPPAPTPQKAQEAKPGPQDKKQAANPGPADKPPTKNPGDLSKLGGVGMPSTGAKTPDNKLAGPTLPNTALGKSGGVVGSGMNQAGAPRKGTGKADYMGVEGVNNNKASGVNLSKLGLGVGKIMSKTGAGAISTNFKSSAGGAGGGMGSASKTYGLGGVGGGKSLGLAGAGGSVNNFGSGSGGLLSGQGGLGGSGGSGLGGAFGDGGGGGGGGGGRGRANVTVPPGDPVVSGGLTSQEIMAVIRANLNQIRHCYEQLLQRAPNASGKMSVNFVIDVSGRVQTTSVTDSTISDSVMRGCVTGKIQRWAFPKPRGGQPVTVNYPFVFNPL